MSSSGLGTITRTMIGRFMTATSSQSMPNFSAASTIVCLNLAAASPLVFKHDNGSAFLAAVTEQALTEALVTQLFSPPGQPQFNGGAERGNGVLKTYTHQHAQNAGHPFRWTSDDVEHAQQLANTLSRPWAPADSPRPGLGNSGQPSRPRSGRSSRPRSAPIVS